MTQVITLRLLYEIDDIKFYIYPVVLKNENDLTLIDAGYPQSLTMLEKAFCEKDLDINQLRKVIITHHDVDHMGGVMELLNKYPKVEAFCSKKELPYVMGVKKSPRIREYERLYEKLGQKAKEDNKRYIEMLQKVNSLERANVLVEQDRIYEDVIVLETPGHMEGHLSLYVEASNTLICGDLLISEEGVLDIATKEFVIDKEAEIQSLRKVLPYPIVKLICYHGGEYESKQLKEELEDIIECGYPDE
ncbi:MAG: MBL fold metallo-hydrolase [Candidatus Galacturonibacter soehngenii]|nr:MBL fold metallo-hydrolase [Candidatus Galacturonibacter soehngenii]